jgi:hypothetical protein
MAATTNPILVFTKLAEAQAFQARVSAKFGYPQPSVPIGGGIHSEVGTPTQHESAIIAHPAGGKWCVPVTARMSADIDAKADAKATHDVMDVSWHPVPAARAAVAAPVAAAPLVVRGKKTPASR